MAAANVLRAQDDAPAAAAADAAAPASAPAPPRSVSWSSLPSNILHDQNKIWLFPAKVAHGRHLLPVFAVAGVAAALVATDPYDAPYFRRTSSFQNFNRILSGNNTSLAIAVVPASLYALGLVRKDSYQQQTSLLAGEAAVDSLILVTALKLSTQRLRPSDIPQQGNFSDNFFERNHPIFSGSFPSGHTIVAFSVATVFAERYRKHRWVPWLAYGAAGVISFSRISLQAHFPSDVFLGAALGYSISRFAVLRP